MGLYHMIIWGRMYDKRTCAWVFGEFINLYLGGICLAISTSYLLYLFIYLLDINNNNDIKYFSFFFKLFHSFFFNLRWNPQSFTIFIFSFYLNVFQRYHLGVR